MFHRFSNLSKVHFVGVGGAGMSGIAEVLTAYELKVSGCDQVKTEVTDRLEEAGVEVFEGHSEDHLEDVDLVVISSAISEESEEVRAARARKITVVRRAEMLSELMRLKYGIAVAGTHGKTTTTSLIGTLFTDAGLDPTVIVGGRMRVSGTGARTGKSDYLVAEADEFDRSFLRLQPIIAVITSVDTDHLDTYSDLDEIRQAFTEFAKKVPFFGQVIICLDDHNIQEILPDLVDRRVVSYGLSPQADLSATDIETVAGGIRFTLRHLHDGELGRVELPMPGTHNVQNALAAVAVGFAVGLGFDSIAKALKGFSGVHRRFERLGMWKGATVVDDYAHHPTEVEATLRAARQAFPQARLHAVFQPHLFSRTRDLDAEFGRSLLGADFAMVTEIYPSRESPIPDVSGDLVVNEARASGHRNVDYCPTWERASELLAQRVREGDLVLTLGAGNIYLLAQELVAEGDS
jgi:UDP-N-acetylmuramate--alanine ligase